MFVLIFFTVVLAFFLYRLFAPGGSRHALPLPPGPKPWPVLGNLPHLGPLPHHSLAALARQYGPLMHLRLGFVDVVVAASASVASQFLKTHDANFSNRPPNSGAKHLAYNYQDLVFAPYGPRWRMLRKISSVHMFSGKALDDHRHVRQAHGIDHLVIPTRDYLFAPSFVDIDRAVEFIHENASCGEVTYVHCKAGRGRSTTIVLCYLVKYKNMTPSAALDYVRSRRPRVLLAPSQWKAVLEYSRCGSTTAACSPSGDAVLITKDDLEGYHGTYDDTARKQLAIVPKMVKASPMIARLSCLFASLKVSGNCGPVARRLSVPEPRAC